MDTKRDAPHFLAGTFLAHDAERGVGVSTPLRARIDATLESLGAKIRALCRRLSPVECLVLGKLLEAVRGHPFIGDAAAAGPVEATVQPTCEDGKSNRRRDRELGQLALSLAGPRALPDDLPEQVGEALAPVVVDFVAALDADERLQFRELLSNALGGLTPSGEIPRGGWRRAAWDVGVAGLTTTGRGGATLIGRPTIVTDERFTALAAEADIQYWLAARTGMRMTAPPGRVARALGADPELVALVSRVAGRNAAPGNGFKRNDNATFLYYDAPGDGIQPHVDPIGLVNALLMIEHVPPADGSGGSALVLYRPGGALARIPLTPGDLVVLEGAGTVHSRDRMKPGERVVVLSLIFH